MYSSFLSVTFQMGGLWRSPQIGGGDRGEGQHAYGEGLRGMVFWVILCLSVLQVVYRHFTPHVSLRFALQGSSPGALLHGLVCFQWHLNGGIWTSDLESQRTGSLKAIGEPNGKGFAKVHI